MVNFQEDSCAAKIIRIAIFSPILTPLLWLYPLLSFTQQFPKTIPEIIKTRIFGGKWKVASLMIHQLYYKE